MARSVAIGAGGGVSARLADALEGSVVESDANGPRVLVPMERMVAGKTRAEWEPVRVDYEGQELTVRQIAVKYRTSVETIRRAALVFHWRLRRPRMIDRTDLIERLFRVLDVQILLLEEDVNSKGRDEVAILGRLVGSLDKLIAIKDAETSRPRPKSTTRRLSDIKGKLIERIEHLKKS